MFYVVKIGGRDVFFGGGGGGGGGSVTSVLL